MTEHLPHNTRTALILFITVVCIAYGTARAIQYLTTPFPPKPCSEYAYTIINDLPARCYGYWSINR